MHTHRTRALLGVALAAALAAPATGAAQDLPWQAGTGATYERYSFGDADAVGVSSISLLTFPFAARTVVGPNVTVELAGAFASANLSRPGGESASISSLTDTELRATYPFTRGANTFSVTGVAVLPTGYTGYTEGEAQVAGAIASDLLPFRVSNWGSGGGFALAGSAARSVGDLNLGLSLGYRVTSEFEPVSDFAYRPGNEARLRVAADRTIGGDRKASVHLTVFSYGEDRIEGESFLDAGDRVQLVGSYAFPAPLGASAIAYAGLLHRTEGAFLEAFGAEVGAGDDPPSQTLLLLGSGARVASPFGFLLPSADLRMFSRADGVGQGWVLGLGTGAELPISDSLTGVPTLRLRFGNFAAGEDAESGLAGIEAGFTVRFGDSSL